MHHFYILEAFSVLNVHSYASCFYFLVASKYLLLSPKYFDIILQGLNSQAIIQNIMNLKKNTK